MGRLARFDKCEKCNGDGEFGLAELFYYSPKLIDCIMYGKKVSLSEMEQIIFSLIYERSTDLFEEGYDITKFVFVPQFLYRMLCLIKNSRRSHIYEIIEALCRLEERGILNTRIIHGKLDMLNTGFLHVAFEIDFIFLHQ